MHTDIHTDRQADRQTDIQYVQVLACSKFFQRLDSTGNRCTSYSPPGVARSERDVHTV